MLHLATPKDSPPYKGHQVGMDFLEAPLKFQLNWPHHLLKQELD